jgi:alpha-L-arabinofuranosidase
MPENQVPYLKAAASLNRDGSKLYLAVVNLHLSESIRTQIRVNGFQPASQARSWTLTGPGLDANNGVDMRGQARQVETKAGLFSQGRPGTVRPVAGTVSGVSSSFSYSFVPLSLTAFQLDAR